MTSDVRDQTAPLSPVVGADAHSLAWKERCLNCGAALSGPFCAECGQRALPPHPTVGELAGDAFAEFSGWDGKFAETIQLLLRKPGEITRLWLAGKRAAFISPLRLYLTASLLYFIAAASAPQLSRTVDGKEVYVGFHVGPTTGGAATPNAPERVAEAAQKSGQGVALTAEEKAAALRDAERAPAYMRPMIRKVIQDPVRFRADVLRMMPRVLFGLLPVFAGILALFYRRRHYPEHLYFAIHLHAFIFVALFLAELAKFTGNFMFAGTVGSIAGLWVLAYGLLALRRVYGGGWMATLAKGVGIGFIYAIASAIGLLGLVFVSAL